MGLRLCKEDGADGIESLGELPLLISPDGWWVNMRGVSWGGWEVFSSTGSLELFCRKATHKIWQLGECGGSFNVVVERYCKTYCMYYVRC